MVLLMSGWLFAGAQTSTIYTCPMHPKIQMEKPGMCPICGMKLEKKEIKAAPKKEVNPSNNLPSVNKDSNGLNMEMDTADKMHMHAGVHEMHTDMADLDTGGWRPDRVNVKSAKTVRYDLYITDTMVNFTGKEKHAYAINGFHSGPCAGIYGRRYGRNLSSQPVTKRGNITTLAWGYPAKPI